MHRLFVLVFVFACSGKVETVPAPPTDPAPSASGIEAPASDRAEVAQATLDVAELQQYFHGRTPLRIVINRMVNPAWKLAHGGQAVGGVDETSEDPRIEFTLLRVEGDKAGATIRYEVEGVVMHAEFARVGGAWKLTKSDLAEE